MSVRQVIRLSILCSSFAFSLAGCAAPPKEIAANQPATSSSAAPAGDSSTVAVGHGGSTASAGAMGTVPKEQAAGTPVKWTTPGSWQTGPEKPMRAATYLIPAAAGDSEGGECAVFANIGGGVEANIKRWIGQFEQPDGSSSEAKAKQKKETINGFAVTTVDLLGTFAGGGMAMGQPATKKPNYRLLGAIVETPQGEVFFKFTGPVKTVTAAQADFQALLKSLKN